MGYSPCFAQDLIIKRDHSEINCKIIKQDNLFVYYSVSRLDLDDVERVVTLSIKKEDVFIYYLDSEKYNFKLKALRRLFLNCLKQTLFLLMEHLEKDLHFMGRDTVVGAP